MVRLLYAATGAGLAALIAVPSFAAPSDDLNCSDLGSLDQARLNVCAYRDVEASQHSLDIRLRGLLTAHPELDGYIKASQKAWIEYRNAQCALESTDMEGGSAQGEYYSHCVAKKNRARMHDLDPDQWIVANP